MQQLTFCCYIENRSVHIWQAGFAILSLFFLLYICLSGNNNSSGLIENVYSKIMTSAMDTCVYIYKCACVVLGFSMHTSYWEMNDLSNASSTFFFSLVLIYFKQNFSLYIYFPSFCLRVILYRKDRLLIDQS